MPGRKWQHIREPTGAVVCLYQGRGRNLGAQLPPTCETCGRTLTRGVWSRAAWEAREERQRRRKRKEWLDIMETRRRRKYAATEAKPKINWVARLAAMREERGLDAAGLAKLTGSSPRTVEGWVQGRHRPDRRARVVLREVWKELVAQRAAVAAQEAAERDED